jgi:hypothetical protein
MTNPSLPPARASLRVPCVSTFGAEFITLLLRHDGSLGSSAGDVSRHYRDGTARVCVIQSDYPHIPDSVFVVRESAAALVLAEVTR